MSRLGGKKEDDVDSLKKSSSVRTFSPPPFSYFGSTPPVLLVTSCILCRERLLLFVISGRQRGRRIHRLVHGTWGRTKIRPSDKEIAIANHGQVCADPVSHIIAPRISIFFEFNAWNVRSR